MSGAAARRERSQDGHRPDWVRGNLLPTLFGITTEAARKYRDRGVWLQGKHWKYDPVKRVVYSPQAISEWLAS